MAGMGEGTIVFSNRAGGLMFCAPLEVVCARTLSEVRPCLDRLQAGVAQGLFAAGFLAYEAAAAFDPAMAVHPPDSLPLVWFGLYRAAKPLAPLAPEPYAVGAWTPLVNEAAYHRAIDRIREYIAAGDTYQVNYTFPSEAAFQGDTFSWFTDLCRAQAADHCAYVDAGRHTILSASPELFFRLDGTTLTTKPMKGTRPRGLWPARDAVHARELAESAKERAENVMIVDLLRSDMGRVSRPGSVETRRLFDVEQYRTVWQMTSTIASQTDAEVPAILAALFPSGSVTGAPKIHTMEIIRELEAHPRGAYCGAVGWWGPNRQAEFNVAIRTVTVDREQARARYSVGGGITWDSTPDGEFAECRAKTAVLAHRTPHFELLESLLYDNGYFLLEEHLRRVAESAAYFDVPFDTDALRAALDGQAAKIGLGPHKVRVRIDPSGSVAIDAAPAPVTRTVRLGFACCPVDSSDVFLYHKTTHRAVYEAAKASRPDCDDVLLWNERGEVTESTTANLAVKINGVWLTPPVASGLLGGTLRARLLAEGRMCEAVLKKTDVVRAEAVKLINSVRKWIPVRLVDTVL